jgi:ABC-2 type transport system ATP-binding protein
VSETVLEVQSVNKQFASVKAVDAVSFTANRGEILGLLGPNGAGKTTTIRMIMGIIPPDTGTIRLAFDGKSTAVDKERIGYLPEERGLYDDARVLDVLVYFGSLKGMNRDTARRRARAWLERFDLGDRERERIERLSKGMAQKAQFIAAILHEPTLLVLDEPFAGLDPVHQDLFEAIIRELRDTGTTILLSSHQMNRVEALCDRIFLINRGRRVLYGELEALKEAHGEHAVRLRFSGEPGFLEQDQRIRNLMLDGDRAIFTLRRGVDPDRFLRELPENIAIREIAIEWPGLHELFIAAVKGKTR